MSFLNWAKVGFQIVLNIEKRGFFWLYVLRFKSDYFYVWIASVNGSLMH